MSGRRQKWLRKHAKGMLHDPPPLTRRERVAAWFCRVFGERDRHHQRRHIHGSEKHARNTLKRAYYKLLRGGR